MNRLLTRLLDVSIARGARLLSGTDAWENLMLLQGTQAAIALRQLTNLSSLGDAEFKVFSQFGEDGIIEWLIANLPDIPKSFIEFGVEDYSESNTRFLIRNRNWRGLVIDGSAANIDRIRRNHAYWKHDLTAVAAFIDRDNINDLISMTRFAGEIGILSVDLDGNDYWIWETINVVNPWIVIIEYNAIFGDLRPLTIPYDPLFNRNRAHLSNLYFGTSVKALELLAAIRGYSIIGTNRAGHNAFFLRNDLVGRFDNRITDRRPLPSLYRESRAVDGSLTYLCGLARRDAIAEMQVLDVASGALVPLKDAGAIYSPFWRKIMGDST